MRTQFVTEAQLMSMLREHGIDNLADVKAVFLEGSGHVSVILIAHCGPTKVSREELKMIPVPESTRTFKPVPHHEIVDSLVEALGFRYIGVVPDEYAVSPDGMKMFGVLDLNPV